MECLSIQCSQLPRLLGILARMLLRCACPRGGKDLKSSASKTGVTIGVTQSERHS
jgi:hypothetical protein